MRIGPRQELLDVWRAVAAEGMADGRTWRWGSGEQRNSVQDAEQLLCILSPATTVPSFQLDQPDRTASDLLVALAPLGSVVEIPRRIADVALDYLQTYTNEHGEPTYAGESRLETTDAYTVAVRLTLAILGFVRVFRISVQRVDLLERLRRLEELAGRRLEGALVGLLRSFAINVFDPDSEQGISLLTLVNQSGRPMRRVREELTDRFGDIRAALRDTAFDGGYVPDEDAFRDAALDDPLYGGSMRDLENYYKLFECGWAWGVVRDVPPFEIAYRDIVQPRGIADSAPSLWATAVALDGLQALWSERTRLLGLLNDEQQRLATALQVRWDITQSYWSRVARFDDRRWPLEDLPWRTTGGHESDYLSLQVCSVVIQDLRRRPDPEATRRVARVLGELAERARITRRPGPGEALSLHLPGYPTELVGSEDAGGERLTVQLADFSAQLLKQAVLVAETTRDVDGRRAVLDLVDRVWEEHIARRRLPSGVWDRPMAVLDPGFEDEGAKGPSWSFTERVVGALVSAAHLIESPPLRSPGLLNMASDLLAEADHLYDRELMRLTDDAGSAMNHVLGGVRRHLRQAHEVLDDQPGTALALVLSALERLAELQSARRNAWDY